MYFHSRGSEHKEINKKMMRIELTQKNDIKIQWNFNGILMPKVFRRHVFVSLSWDQKQINKALNTMKKCYQYFKSGDLYTFATPTQKNLDWFQKIKIDNFMCSFDQEFQDQEGERKCFIKNQLLSLHKLRQPCFVVIFCDPRIVSLQIQALIEQLRSNNFKSLVFLVSTEYTNNYLDYSKGIFKIAQRQSHYFDFQRVYKYYNDHLACLETKVTVQSKNGQIFFQQGAIKSNSFDSFTRSIIYPLANQFTDIIETYKLYTQKTRHWKFLIKLQYKLLDGQIFRDQKQIRVPLQQEIDKYVTYNFAVVRTKKHQLFFGFDLQNNPFSNLISLRAGVGLK